MESRIFAFGLNASAFPYFPMKRDYPYSYYALGVSLAPLNLIADGVSLGILAFRNINSALTVLRNLQTVELELPIEETKRTGGILLRALEVFFPSDPAEVEKIDYDYTLTPENSTYLLRLVGEFDIALRTELNKLEIYHVQDVGLFNATTLMAHGERMFSVEVLALFPQQFVDELRQAGKCIAVEIPTGAAFFL